MWFAVGFGGYRAKVLLKNFNAGEVPGSDPKLVAAFLNRLDFLFNALYIFGGIAAVVFVVALIPWIGPHWRSRVTRALAWLAGGSVIAALAVGFASLWANMSASLLIERNLNYFKDVLHGFGIREAAEGRFRDFSERVRRNDRFEMKTVSRLSEMPRDVRRKRIQSLLVSLKEHPLPILQKAVLTTLSDLEFTDRPLDSNRHWLTGDERKLVIENAASLAGTKFDTVDEAMKWVKKQPEADGWQRIPRFYFIEKPATFVDQ